jgi:hypothetical protein
MSFSFYLLRIRLFIAKIVRHIDEFFAGFFVQKNYFRNLDFSTTNVECRLSVGANYGKPCRVI